MKVEKTNHPLVSIALAAAELAGACENLVKNEGASVMSAKDKKKCVEYCNKASSFGNWAEELK